VRGVTECGSLSPLRSACGERAGARGGFVIPGRREAASPESITADLAELSPRVDLECRRLWIPGSRPSAAPRNDEIKIRSRDALRPRFANHKDDSPPAAHDPEKLALGLDPRVVSSFRTRSCATKREAERRKAHAVHCPRHTSKRHRLNMHGRGSGLYRKPARLPALRRGTRQGSYPLAQLRAALPGITGCEREDPPRRQCSEHLADRS
jgi:hypothetical protein